MSNLFSLAASGYQQPAPSNTLQTSTTATAATPLPPGEAIYIAALDRGSLSAPQNVGAFDMYGGSQSRFHWIIWLEGLFSMERYVGYYWMVEKLPPPATAQQAIGASRPLWRLRTNYIKPELEKFPIYMVGMAKIGDAYCKDDVRISSAEDVYDALRWVRLPLASEDFTQWVRRAVEALKRSDRVAVSPALDTDVLLDGVTAKAAEWFEEYKKLPRDKGWRAKEEKIPRDNSFCR